MPKGFAKIAKDTGEFIRKFLRKIFENIIIRGEAIMKNAGACSPFVKLTYSSLSLYIDKVPQPHGQKSLPQDMAA